MFLPLNIMLPPRVVQGNEHGTADPPAVCREIDAVVEQRGARK
jgi:hypothetical protein